MSDPPFDGEALNRSNLEEINKLHPGAFYMVKSLMLECERPPRDTWLRLHDAVPDGHSVRYEVLRGDPDLVLRLARALGFAKVTNDTLEVRSV
jgi:hypothetical protein